jgi:DNA-binding response OmpR family regulator
MANKRLLIIEDDFDVAEMLLMYFQSHNYEVIHADTGVAGIELARTRFPNLILLDVMLPVMDGYDVCVRLRQQSLTKYIPIMFLTQRDERSAKVKGLELGADGYVTKPFDIDELRLRVEGAINRATRESLHEARTGLPTGPLIEDETSRRQMDGKPFSELRLSIEGYKTFEDVYGFMASKEVLSHAAKLLQEIVSQTGSTDDFVGIQHDEFVILTHAQDVEGLEKQIKDKFAEAARAFYTFADAERGGILINAGTDTEKIVPLMTFSVKRSSVAAQSS